MAASLDHRSLLRRMNCAVPIEICLVGVCLHVYASLHLFACAMMHMHLCVTLCMQLCVT